MESYYNFHHLPRTNMPSKFVYVKQDFVNHLTGPSKVLVNPNFKPKVQVHINPNFKSLCSDVKHNVYVNPNMLKKNTEPPPDKTKSDFPENTKTAGNKNVYINPKMLKKEKEVENSKIVPVQDTKTAPVENKNKIVVSTQTKLIRVASNVTTIKNVNGVKTRFKIVRSSDLPKQKLKVKSKLSPNVWKSPKYLLTKKLATKNISVKSKNRKLKLQYINISGVVYRKTHNTLKLTKRNENSICIQRLHYRKDVKQKMLQLLATKDFASTNLKQIRVGGVTFKKNNKNVFINNNVNKIRLLSSAKSKSIQTLTNKMKKSNVSCPFYRKFGRCKGKEKGTCIRVHNPDQISLCPKFLQGMCNNEKCLLSHKVSAEKMPTCRFYLEGQCSKDNCPYVHVKINVKADVCRDFLQGFCSKAEKCEKRHQFLCPEFEKDGKCHRKVCPYPHVNVRTENKPVDKVPIKPIKTCKKIQTNCNDEKNKQIEDNHSTDKNARYYKESKCFNNGEINDKETSDATDVLRARPKLGELPSYIPLSNKNL